MERDNIYNNNFKICYKEICEIKYKQYVRRRGVVVVERDRDNIDNNIVYFSVINRKIKNDKRRRDSVDNNIDFLVSE